MYDAGNGKHYFIDEPACLRDGQMIIPLQWLEDGSSVVYCDAWEIKCVEHEVCSFLQVGLRKRAHWDIKKLSKIEDEVAVMVASSELKHNMLNLQDMSLMPEWCPETLQVVTFHTCQIQIMHWRMDTQSVLPS